MTDMELEIRDTVDNGDSSVIIEKESEDLADLPSKSQKLENLLQVPIPSDDKASGIANDTLNLSKQEKIDQILSLKGKLSQLIENIRDTKLVCEKYENENQYLQDYVGNYMKSDLK